MNHIPPQKRYSHILTGGTPYPSPSEYLIWIEGLYRGNQVKMELLGQVLVQYDWCSNEKGKSALGPTHTEDHAKTHRENPGHQRSPHTPRSGSREEASEVLPWSHQRDHAQASLDLWPPELRQYISGIFSYPVWRPLLEHLGN